MTRLTPRLKELIEQLYGEGLYINQVANELKLSRPTVHNYLVSQGIVSVPEDIQEYGATRFSDEALEGMLEDYQDGDKVEDILERYSISRPAFYRHIRNKGIPTRYSSNDGSNMARAVNAYDNGGDTVKDILERFDVSRTSFYRELKRRGEKVE